MERQSFLSGLLRAASGRQDLVVVILLITAIGAMILPITPTIADFLIAINMGVSVILLMVAFYITSPVDFSAMPSVILISTVFRLSISIAATRLILLEADGGQIIQTFGDFVISGNVVVGLVIFLIITVVQFLVITKGSERVAEVAARFSLDGLPGKQMSIDSDLRNGDIDQAEARRRRSLLERESQLYGAMDGAMKFVKGDAIAGLIIIAVNLFGGMAVGMLQRGISFKESTQIFSLLTIGEGLIAQIPALFISLTAGTIVTRVTTGNSQNLGADIVSQITARPEALRLGALVMLGLAFVPGFPTPVFLILAILAGASGTLLLRKIRTQATPAPGAAARLMTAEVSTLLPSPAGTPVTVVVSPSLFASFERENIALKLRAISDTVAHDAGFATPRIGYRVDAVLANGRYVIELDMVPETTRDLVPDRVYVRASQHGKLEKLGIPSTQMGGSSPAYLSVELSYVRALEGAGVKVFSAVDVLENDVIQVIEQNAAHFVGVQETRRLLSSLENEYRDLLKEVQKSAPIQRIADVLKRLLEEGVSIRNMRVVLETLLEHAPREQDTQALTNHLRAALKRQICYRYGGTDRVLRAFMVERDYEEFLRRNAQPAGTRNDFVVDAEVTSHFLKLLGQRMSIATEKDLETAVILTSPDTRRLIWTIVSKSDRRFPVLSYNEIAPDYSIYTIATLGVHGRGAVSDAQILPRLAE
jgi:type III secretion protein V